MSYARQMLDTYPRVLDVDVGLLAGAIDAMTDCAQACIADTDLSWLKLVRKSAGVVDSVEGLAEVVRGGVGGGYGLLSGLDLDLAVAAGGLDELPDRPAGSRLDPAAGSEGSEHDVQVGVDGVALAVVDGPGLQV